MSCDRCVKLNKECTWPSLTSRRAGRPRPRPGASAQHATTPASELLQDGHAIEASDLDSLLNAPDSTFESMAQLIDLPQTAQPSDGSQSISAASSPVATVLRPHASDPLIDVFFERCAHFVPFMPQRRVFDTLAISTSPIVRAGMSLIASAFVSNGLAAAQAYRQTAVNAILSDSPATLENILERLATLLLVCWFDYGDARPMDSRASLQLAVAQLVQSGALMHVGTFQRSGAFSTGTESAAHDMLLKTIHEVWATDVILQVTIGDRLSVIGQLKLSAPLPRDYCIGRAGEAPVQLSRLKALAILHFASGNESSPFHESTLTGLQLDQPSSRSTQGIETTIDNMLPVVQGALGRLVVKLPSEPEPEQRAAIRADAEAAFMATLMLLSAKVFLVQRRSMLLNPMIAEKCSTPAEIDTVFAPLDTDASEALRPALDILNTIRDDLNRHGTNLPFHSPFFGCAHIVSSHAIVKYLIHIGSLPALPPTGGSAAFPSALELSSSFDLLEESARRQSVTWPCASQSMKRLVAYRLASASFCEWNNMVEFQKSAELPLPWNGATSL